ncbi:MAG: oxygenase MpaB family protein [Pseudomonadota bacterium]
MSATGSVPLPAQRFISETEFRDWAEHALRRSVDPVAGIYGPDSLMWKLNRESIGFFGGGRAALLQLAHPWIANSIDQHSQTRNDPLGRFRRTFINVFTMIYGSTDQVMRVANNVHNIHRTIKGTLPEESGAFAQGSHYEANEASAMLWVHGTLWDTQIRMNELVFPALTRDEKERYYQDTKLFAYLFGIPDEIIPPDWGAFQEYMDAMYASDQLVARRVGREMGDMIFDFNGPLKPALKWLKVMTSYMMPPRLREEFRLPEDTPENRRTYDRGLKIISTVYPRLPERVRFVPSYIEAQRRIAGKPSADLFTQGLNLAWLGQRELVSAGA